MKACRRFFLIAAIVSSFFLQSSFLLKADSTIDATNKYAYGANIGWMDFRGDTNNGAVIGEYVCSGYVWSANIGWINLGSGSPANGIRYQNNSATDFGVNHDGHGGLYGFAWAPNIGWLNFAPSVDLKTGNLLGYVYSANCGWILLSNAFAHVQTDSMPAALGTNGLPIAWMLTYFGTTNVSAEADADGDGMSNREEYLARTNPTNSTDRLTVSGFTSPSGGPLTTLTWQSAPGSLYLVQKTPDLAAPTWLDSGLGLISPDGTTTTRSFADTNAPVQFYRVQAVKPLSP